MVRASFIVNDRQYQVEVEAGETLLHVLRERLHLTGTKEGCLEGECGACTVLVEGEPVDSCLTAALAVSGLEVTTIEGVAEHGGVLSPLQDALWRSGGIQCGFCTPGFVMTLRALLAYNPTPDENEIRHALAGNICRCTGYRQIVEAVSKVVRAAS